MPNSLDLGRNQSTTNLCSRELKARSVQCHRLLLYARAAANGIMGAYRHSTLLEVHRVAMVDDSAHTVVAVEVTVGFRFTTLHGNLVGSDLIGELGMTLESLPMTTTVDFVHKGLIHASIELILNLTCLTVIAFCKVNTTSYHGAVHPVVSGALGNVTEDTMSHLLDKGTANVLTAAFSTVHLLTVIMSAHRAHVLRVHVFLDVVGIHSALLGSISAVITHAALSAIISHAALIAVIAHAATPRHVATT